MVSKILFIAILIAVHEINGITTLIIHTCQNDQDVYNNVNENKKWIIPILVIENTNNNPLKNVYIKNDIESYCEQEKILLLLVVPADKCIKTDNYINSSTEEYPSLFMIKWSRLLPGKKIFTSIDIDVFKEFYQFAVHFDIDGGKGDKFLTKLRQAIRNKNDKGQNFFFYMCQNDQQVKNYLTKFNKGIVPILVIANTNSNPLNNKNIKKDIELFCRDEMLSILLVVPADGCIATDFCLNENSREYPSLFMLREGRLIPEKRIYSTIDNFKNLYRVAICYNKDGRKTKTFLSVLNSAIMDNFISGQSSQVFNSTSSGFIAPTQGPLAYQTKAPWSMNPGTNQPAGQIARQWLPSGYPVRLTAPLVNQVGTQTAVPVLGQLSYQNLPWARNSASTSFTELARTSTIPPGRQDDYQQMVTMRPHSLNLTQSLSNQKRENRYPQGGTWSTTWANLGRSVETYPIERELQTQDLLIGQKRPVEDQSYKRSSNLKTIDFLGVNRLTSTSKKPRMSPSA